LLGALDGAAVELATAWRISRTDGRVIGLTDWDAPIAFDGVAHEPAAIGVRAQAATAGLDADSARALAALDDARLMAADLAGGLFDDAELQIWRVVPRDPALRVRTFRGRLGAVKRTVSGFEAEVRDAKAALERPVGRVYARSCDARFGDARFDADLARFTAVTRIIAVPSARRVRLEGLSAFAESWFSGRMLRWGAVGRARIQAHRREGAAASLDLEADPVGGGLAVGMEVRVEAGCDKTFEACRTKFANAVDFRGFPHMRGVDGLVRGPAEGDALDGGARR
jgi:uncharacterized phage protein (TIGR02218 family)